MLDEDYFLIFESNYNICSCHCRILYFPSPTTHYYNARLNNTFYMLAPEFIELCN